MPTWTQTMLKAAVAALPTGQTAAQYAATLAAATTTLSNQAFPLSAAKAIARQSATGDWSRIVARSRLTPALPPATAQDAAILAAINVYEGHDADQIDPTNTATWAAWQAGIAALEAVGDLSAATVTAIAALSSPVVAQYAPAPTAADITTATGIA